MISDMTPRWIFDEHEMGRKERNPVNEEFFANNTPLAAIIREGIQNSLDAANGSYDADGNPLPVRVRLYFSGFGPRALEGAVYSKYRANAEEHYRMRKNGLPSGIPDESDRVRTSPSRTFGRRALRATRSPNRRMAARRRKRTITIISSAKI